MNVFALCTRFRCHFIKHIDFVLQKDTIVRSFVSLHRHLWINIELIVWPTIDHCVVVIFTINHVFVPLYFTGLYLENETELILQYRRLARWCFVSSVFQVRLHEYNLAWNMRWNVLSPLSDFTMNLFSWKRAVQWTFWWTTNTYIFFVLWQFRFYFFLNSLTLQ